MQPTDIAKSSDSVPVSSSKSLDKSPAKTQAKTPEEIKKMEEEALASKSTVLKSTEETEALK